MTSFVFTVGKKRNLHFGFNIILAIWILHMAPFLVRNYMCIRFIDEVSVLRTDVLNEFPHSHEKKVQERTINSQLFVRMSFDVYLPLWYVWAGSAMRSHQWAYGMIWQYFHISWKKENWFHQNTPPFYHFFPSSSSSPYGWINCIHIKPTTTTLKRVAEMCVLYGSNKNPEWIRYDSFLIHIILHFSCACVCKLLLGMWNMCLFLG